MASTLTYQEIRKTFAGSVAIESFDLAMEPGELITLLGPSGCGKTTALRIAAGFEQPDSGAVLVDGRNVLGTPPHRRNMGMVFQSYSLFPNLDVSANVAFGLRVRRVAKADQERRVGEALERVHLSHLANRYPHQLSGGQQQRVALARALVFEPAVLLLDEPLSALDAKVRVNLREEIRRLQLQLGMTTLFVTHDQEEALSISDRVGVMSNGRLEQLGSPRDVYAAPATAFVARFVGRINELPAEVVADGLEVAGVRIGVSPPSGAAVGATVTVMSRPEDVRVHRPGATANGAGLPGTVVSEHFAGATSLLRVRLDRLDALVDAQRTQDTGDSGPGHAPGDRVELVLTRDKVLVVE
jgi:putative spermidine/putrescine transport system ATP-binding protein